MQSPQQSTPAGYPPARKAWYAVGVLGVAYVFSFIDRQILSLLVAPIRRDLHISDTQVSLLIGISFAFLYTLFGFSIGRMADSRSRRNLIATGVFSWSLFTAACGLTSSFFQMFLMRMGVGAGEAALSPPAYSLIADYFPPERRPLALSVYGAGMYVGAGLALILGGIIVPYTLAGGTVTLPLIGLEVYRWQLTFFLVGLPGLLVAALVRTIQEPVRRESRAAAGAPISAVIAYINEHRATFAFHHLATALISFASYSYSAWVPSSLVRTYGWSIGSAGLAYGSVVALFSTLGILAGGWYCDFLARRGYRDAHFRVGLIVTLLNLPLILLLPHMPTAEAALVLLAPTCVLGASIFGVAPAALQQAVPNEMRAQVSAMYLYAVNIIGLGAGPTVVALITDRVFHEDDMLRYSLMIASTGAYLLSALLWRLGFGPFRRTLEQAEDLRTLDARTARAPRALDINIQIR